MHKARQKPILREFCPVDDWSRNGFNEMSSENSEKFLTVLTKMSENQNSLENRIDALTQKPNSPQQKIHQITIKTTNNKLGEGISEAERTKIEETEDIQIIKDIKIETVKIKDRIIIKTTQIAADMVIISIEEAIGGEITLEAVIEETSRITITIISKTAIFRSKDIKITKQQYILEIQEGILKLLHFHKKFAIVAVIQTIPLEIVKLKEKVVPEVDKYRSTRNQKTNKATHVSLSGEQH